jgi:Fe(3+) dicitrate transport protein
MANVDTTCGNEGRLRQYYSFGVDSRGELDWRQAGCRAADRGVRLHAENQERFQWNGDRPDSRRPGRASTRGARAERAGGAGASGFVQNELFLGDVTLNGGLRYERIAYDRSNKLTGSAGKATLRN